MVNQIELTIERYIIPFFYIYLSGPLTSLCPLHCNFDGTKNKCRKNYYTKIFPDFSHTCHTRIYTFERGCIAIFKMMTADELNTDNTIHIIITSLFKLIRSATPLMCLPNMSFSVLKIHRHDDMQLFQK